jgi:hypothetical protein
MRPSRRFAWLLIITAPVILALMWQWAYHDSRHALLDSATMWTLTIGFLAGSADRLRGLKNTSENPSAAEKRDALLVFPAEDKETQEAVEAPTPSAHALGVRLAWFTFLTHAVLMIALSWRWAFQHEPYTILGAVTLSTLMLGFFQASATAVAGLGRSAAARAPRRNEDQNALLLFPAEESVANDFVRAPRLLATGRKALL